MTPVAPQSGSLVGSRGVGGGLRQKWGPGESQAIVQRLGHMLGGNGCGGESTLKMGKKGDLTPSQNKDEKEERGRF